MENKPNNTHIPCPTKNIVVDPPFVSAYRAHDWIAKPKELVIC